MIRYPTLIIFVVCLQQVLMAQNSNLKQVFFDDFTSPSATAAKFNFYNPYNTFGTTTDYLVENGYLELRQSVTDAHSSAMVQHDFSLASRILINCDLYFHAGWSKYYFMPSVSFFDYSFANQRGMGGQVQFQLQTNMYTPDNPCGQNEMPSLRYWPGSNSDADPDADPEANPSWIVSRSGSAARISDENSGPFCPSEFRRLNTFENSLSASFYDKWLTDVHIYLDKTTGYVSVDIEGDGNVDLEGVIPLEVSRKLNSVNFSPYGWWTGHMMRVRNLKIYADNENISFYPRLTFSTGSVESGGQNSIMGSGFKAHSIARLNFLINGQLTTHEVATNFEGKFTFTYQSQEASLGYYVQVDAVDLYSGSSAASRMFYVKAKEAIYEPTIQLSDFKSHYQIHQSILVSWSDKMHLNIAGVKYPHDKNGNREYSYTVDSSDNGVDWNYVTILSGNSLSDKTLRFTVSYMPSQIGENFRIRITDNLNSRNVITSEPFSVALPESPLECTLQWDHSFPASQLAMPIGVAADGVARILVKLRHADNRVMNGVSVSLRDANSSNSASQLGKIMPAQNVTDYSEEANDAFKTSDVISTPATSYWFWYVAPDNFAVNGMEDVHAYSSTRSVQLLLKTEEGDSVIQEIEVVRPPLMMVHGLGSDYNCYKYFHYERNEKKEYFTDRETDGPVKTNLFKQRHAVNLADPLGAFNYNASQLFSTNANSNTFAGNIIALREQGYASNQVDYVCHSMGGSVLRSAIQYFNNMYYGKIGIYRNYSQGYVNKAITINTPHNGSPLADLVTEFSSGLNWKQKLFFTDLYSVASQCMVFNFIQPIETNCFWNMCGLNFGPTYALKDLQVSGGVRFAQTDVKNHIIAGDVDLIGSKTASALASMNNYLEVLDKLFEVALKLYPSSVLKTVVMAEKGLRLFTFLEWFSQQKGFPNFLGDGDFIVPLASQLHSAAIPSVFPANTTVFRNSSWWNASHNQIVDRSDVGNRVLDLLNWDVNGYLFNESITANTMQYNPAPMLRKTMQSAAVSPTEIVDTTKIKIISPMRNSILFADSICELTYHLSDTTNLSYVSWYFNGKSDLIVSKDSVHSLRIPVSQEFMGSNMAIVSANYNLPEGYVTYTDTISYNIQTLAELVEFEVMPKRIEMYRGVRYFPSYKATYNNNVVNIPLTSPDLNIQIDDTTIVEYNSTNYSFTGIDTLATFVEIDYKGLKDTIYLNVIDTISAVPDIWLGVYPDPDLLNEIPFSVYPNPTNGLFTLTLNKPDEITVLITNIVGEIVLCKPVTQSEIQLDIRSLPGGIYLIQLISPNNVYQTIKLRHMPGQ